MKDTLVTGSLRVTDTTYTNDLVVTGSKTARYALIAPTSNGAPTWRALTNADVGLGNVENTKLSTWVGTANITTLGTIGTGTWNATKIALKYGGTGVDGTATAINTVFAGPSSGNAGNASFRSLVAADLPTVPVSKGGTGATSFTANSLIMSGNTTTAALTTRAITDRTSVSSLTNVDTWAASTNIPTVNLIANWDGRYQKTNNLSNLTYLNKRINSPTITGGTGVTGSDLGASANPRYRPASWKFNAGITPIDGDVITVKKPSALHDYGTWLSLDNGTTWYPIVYANTSRLPDWFGNNYSITLRFDAVGTCSVYGSIDTTNHVMAATNARSTIMGVWRLWTMYDSGNDTGTLVRDYGGNVAIVSTVGTTYRYMLLLPITDTNYGWKAVPTCTTSNSTATSKTTIYTGEFNPFGDIFYYSHTDTVSGTTSSPVTIRADRIWRMYPVDLRYSFNIGSTLTAGKDVYIVAQMQTKTTAKLRNPGATGDNAKATATGANAGPITQTLPASNDGFIYIRLGRAYNSTNVDISMEHPIYWHDGTQLRLYTPGTVVNLNSIDKTGSVISIYAPTSSGTANYILVSGGANTAPSWLATAKGAAYVTAANGALTFGTLGTAYGGTGNTSFTQWGVIYANPATKLVSTAAGTSGYLLQGNGSAAPSWIQATNANTANTIVKRDASGNFSAGTITAALSGTATRANYLTCPDTRSTALNPNDLTATTMGLRLDFKQKSITGLAAAYSGVLSFRPYSSASDWSGGPAHQLAFDVNGLHRRKSTGDTTWGEWSDIFDSRSRTDIGISPNFDNPGFNGFFEVRHSSETTGETGTKPVNSYYGMLTMKTSDNVAMLQLAGSNVNGWWIRGKQSGSVTLASVDWQRIVVADSGTYSINAATATKATQDGDGNTITSYYCTLSTAQTISGNKTFTGNLYIGSSGAGGYLNGSATDGGLNSILIGNDVWLGDCNATGIMGMKAAGANCGIYAYNSSGTQIGQLYFDGTYLQCNKTISASNGTWMDLRSLRNFESGTLITTDLSGGESNSSIPVQLHVHGYGYGENLVDFYCQLYVYCLGNGYNTYIYPFAISYGVCHPSSVYAFKDANGKLAFWFGRLGYWHGYDINCQHMTGDSKVNHVVSVTDSALPGTRSYTTEMVVEMSAMRYSRATSTNQEGTLWNTIGMKQYNNALPDGLSDIYNYGQAISFPCPNARLDIYAAHIASNGTGLWFRSGWSDDKAQGWANIFDSKHDAIFANVGTGVRQIRWTMGDNDYARILVAGGSNAGYLEIATADDGTEPIYVSQYTGVFSSLTRTLTLLDGSGNTTFPGAVSILSPGSNRATLYLRSVADVPNDFYLGANNTNQWSITCRASDESYFLGFYSSTRGWNFRMYHDGNNYNDGELHVSGWVRFANWTGLYSPNNGAHFYPNNASSYGTWTINGSKNGYYGINLGPGTGYMTLMCDGSGNGGLFCEGNRWPLYYSRDSGCLGLMDSNVSSGYSVQVNGSLYVTSTFYAPSTCYTDSTMNCYSLWANRGSGERQVGVSFSDGSLYFWGNASTGTAGIYSSISGYVIQRSGSTFKVYSAVWNDFAEYRESECTEPGRVLISNGKGQMILSTARLQPVAKIISDTYGMAVGHSDKAKTPMGVAGRVLVIPYQDRTNYKVGDCLCTAPNGTADIMTRDEIIKYPDRIIGIVDEIPDYTIWKNTVNNNENSIEIKGRIWIYVR